MRFTRKSKEFQGRLGFGIIKKKTNSIRILLIRSLSYLFVTTII